MIQTTSPPVIMKAENNMNNLDARTSVWYQLIAFGPVDEYRVAVGMAVEDEEDAQD